MIKKVLVGFTLTSAIVLIGFTESMAVPVGWTISSTTAGDTIMTTDTGLQWLSPTATTNMSRATALGNNSGFVFATQVEFLDLVGAYRITQTAWEDTITSDLSGVESLLDDFGHTLSFSGQTLIAAMLEPGSVSVIAACPLCIEGTQSTYSAAVGGDGGFERIANNWGSWLVDKSGENTVPSPVPEPSTFILMGSGLSGLVFFRKKIRKRVLKVKQ